MTSTRIEDAVHRVVGYLDNANANGEQGKKKVWLRKGDEK